MTNLWRDRRHALVAAALVVVVAAAAVAAGLAWLAARPAPERCLVTDRAGAPVVSQSGGRCDLPVGAETAGLECGNVLTLPAGDFTRSSQRIGGGPAPDPGTSSVLVQGPTCRMTNAPGVETSLRTRRPQPGDAVVLVDFTLSGPRPDAAGLALRSAPGARGVGVSLFPLTGGGVIGLQAQSGRTSGTPGSFTQSARTGSSAGNRLVLCVQGRAVRAWLNGQRLGSGSTTDAESTSGPVDLSIWSGDRGGSDSGELGLLRLYVFRLARPGVC